MEAANIQTHGWGDGGGVGERWAHRGQIIRLRGWRRESDLTFRCRSRCSSRLEGACVCVIIYGDGIRMAGATGCHWLAGGTSVIVLEQTNKA